MVQSSYQQPPISLPDRHFKPLSEDSVTSGTAEQRTRGPLFLRLRRGRGGRILLDRRRPPQPDNHEKHRFRGGKTSRALDASRREGEVRKSGRNLEVSEIRDMLLEEDRMSRLAERWRFDSVGESTGADEEDRMLVDDYDPK